MLEVLYIILKVLCYGILILLGLSVCLLCFILFIPIKYASIGHKNQEEWSVRAKVTYLNPLLRIRVQYPAERPTITKILGVTYKPKDKAERPKSDKSQKKIAPKAKKKVSFVKDVEYYQKLWQENQDLIKDVFRTAINALVTVLPKDMHAKVIYGTGMADVTGFIYAAYCALQSCFPEDFYVEPVWTEKYLEGEYHLKGKIRLFPLVVALIKIISNKNVRILYKKLRRV